MGYDAFIFVFLISGLLIYLASRLGLSIYLDYSNADQVRSQLLQRLRLLQLQPMLSANGLDARELLHVHPLHEMERLIRQCENCDQKQECARMVGRGDLNFDACPLRQYLPGPPCSGECSEQQNDIN